MKTVKCLLFICVLTLPFFANASHMMGAEITYKWVGYKKYEVTARIYRDCRGIALNSPAMNISDYNGTTFSLSYTRTSIKDITVLCSDTIAKPCNPSNTTVSLEGVELHTFVSVVDFSIAPYNTFVNKNVCKVYFSVEQCCRNGAITTINTGNFYVDAMLDLCTSKFHNTSPQFKSNNVLTAACNLPFSQNFGSKDFVDYDSLAYELVSPLNAANTNESYYGNFTNTIPMTPFCTTAGQINCSPSPNAKPPRGFYFNKLTADVVFLPSNCNEVGVIAVKITEYRRDSANTKWQMVGYVIRDIQIAVKVAAGYNNAPTTTLAANYDFRTREKQCIDIKSFDTIASGSTSSNKGDVPFLAIRELPDGATFGYVDSTVKNKTGRLCWTVHDSVYIKFKNKNKLLPMTLEIRDNYCSVPSFAQKSFTIRILPPDSSGFLSINTFLDPNKNNKKDSGEKAISALLKFKDKSSAYYVDTDEKGKLEDSMGIGKVTIGIAKHPYFQSTKGDTSLVVKMDSIHRLNFGLHLNSGIYGRLYFDANANCLYDKGEPTVSGYKVFTDSNKYVGITDHNGVYFINAPKGTYKLTCDYKPAIFSVNCPSSKSISISINGDSAYLNNNFGISRNMKYTDVGTGIKIARLRRGSVSSVTYYCVNNGPTTRKNIKLYSPVSSKFDLTRNSSLYAAAGTTAVINIDSILPYSTFSFKLDFFVSSSSFKSGETLCFLVKTDSITTKQDSVTSNNSAVECCIVDAPYDPNEKLVSADSSKYTTDRTIAYTIHFQNSGTDTATRIVVSDTIDTKYLDMKNFEMNWSDYPCEPIISGNVIHFIFNNINLPFFSKSGDKSMAGFNFSLGLKANVSKETSFSNKAAIYFDFENPIFTKKAIATINSPIAITKISKPTLCKNEINKIWYKSNIAFNNGNKLILELSDLSGSFASPVVLSSFNTVSLNDSINFSIPKTYTAGQYTLRLRSTDPSALGIPFSGNIGVMTIPTPAFALNSNLKNNVGCEKDTLKVTLTGNYLYKVMRNNITTNNYSTTKVYAFPIRLADSFKFIALDNTNGCSDTAKVYPAIFTKPIITANVLNRKQIYCGGEQIDISATGGLLYTYLKGNTPISAMISSSTFNAKLDVNTYYQVIGEDANGCTNRSDTLHVSVKPAPSASITFVPDPICLGDSTTLVYGTAPTYDLYRNKAILLSKTTTTVYKINNPVNGDTYSISAYGSNGCTSKSNEITILINPVPAKPVIMSNNNDLTVNFTGTVKWYRNGILLSNTSNTITNAPGGTYRAIVTNPEGCSSSSNTFIHQNNGLSSLSNSKFNVYPNPASEQLTIATYQDITFDIKLYDINGKLIYSSENNAGPAIIDIHEFSEGLYSLEIEDSEGHIINKMISICR